MKAVYVNAVALAAPGLVGWSASSPILRGEAAYVASELPAYQPALLPPNERRRATATVRLAFRVAEEAATQANIAPAELATVFASSDADLNIIHRISTALTETPRVISPTEFHNSVHNAAAGYWSIATGARTPSTTLSGYDGSFAAGLLEAAALVHIDAVDTLLVVFDLPPPAPLDAKRTIEQPVAVALVLSAEPRRSSIATLHVTSSDARETAMTSALLEKLRLSNPAARALPLLQLLARGARGTVIVPTPLGASLRIDVLPL